MLRQRRRPEEIQSLPGTLTVIQLVAEQETTEHRSLTNQLAEDLDWLEKHSRRQGEQQAQAVQLRYATALVRNVLGPFLNGQVPPPLHVAVVGGAGSGKSTVSNFLIGANVAEANPQAGFTRHPVAYTASEGPVTWAAHLGFLGPLQRLTDTGPSSLDADVYQIRRVPAAPFGFLDLLSRYVVWDCPDMTTWAATGYIPRLVEICALADVVVYVASDERYNDEVPTQFLQMLVESGKAVVVVLTKMREADAPAFVAHFRKEVLARVHGPAVPCLTIPYLSPAELADPVAKARRYQIPLVNQVSVLGEPQERARRHAVRAAADHLLANEERLLSVAREDLITLQAWRNLVLEGQVEFDNRYRREYLNSERFHRFDQALARLLELLELPGIGRILSGALYVVRTPYRLLKNLFHKAIQRPPTPPVPEKPVLEAAMQGWLDMLHKEAARRADTHPVWQHIDKGFGTGLAEATKERFEQGVRDFNLSQADEADRIARSIYEDLEKNPIALNTLRGTKFALEVGAITGSVVGLVAMGTNFVIDAVVASLAASVTHHLVELFGKQYVDARREQARIRQQALVTEHISAPLADWLCQWPASGGSEFERLQLALRRIPLTLRQVDQAVRRAMR
jgi:hypothetical protein